MILEGKIIDINECFGIVEIGDIKYKFPLNVVFGDKIKTGNLVKVRLEDGIVKIVNKYEIVELEEFLDVD